MLQPSFKHLPPPPANKTGWPWTNECSKLPKKISDTSSCPKISIITPSFNQGEFIEETIRSVLLQDYPNFEYIIIDGASSDNTLSIINKYEKWITLWISEKDRGQAHAINKGFKRATGDILAWLNSDDFYAPHALAKVAEANKNNEGTIIAGKIVDFDNNNGHQTIVKQYNISFESIVKFWEGNQWWHQPGLFFPTAAVKKIGYLDENLHYGMDYDLLCRLTQICQTVYLNDIFAHFRLHNKSKTVSTRHMSMFESSKISQKYWPLIGLNQSDKHDKTVTTWFIKRANYFIKRFRMSESYINLSLSLTVSKKFTILAIMSEISRMLMGGRFTGRT
jgi:glycosyltransferase involved in cell wall biosynthesis